MCWSVLVHYILEMGCFGYVLRNIPYDNGVFPESVSQHIVGKLKSPQSIQGVLAERISEKKDSRDSK